MNTATPWINDSRDWSERVRSFAERGRDWLDARGRGAWIAAMVIGFVLVWPVGLTILFYMIWSKRMSCNSFSRTRHHRSRAYGGGTGNAAFDAYREETLKRLEEERAQFTSFLEQLRAAKDKAEFDQFMASRQTPEQPAA